MHCQALIGFLLLVPIPCAQAATVQSNRGVETTASSLCSWSSQKQFLGENCSLSIVNSSSVSWQGNNEEILTFFLSQEGGREREISREPLRALESLTSLAGYQESSNNAYQMATSEPRPALDSPEHSENLHLDDVRHHIIFASRQQKEEAERKLAQAAQIYLLEAHLAISLLRFDEAAEAYEDAIAAVPDSLMTQIAFARFNDILDRIPQALDAYTRALELARRGGDQAAVAATLLSMAVLHLRQNQDAEAREALEEALIIYDRLANRDPDRFSGLAAQVKDLLNR